MGGWGFMMGIQLVSLILLGFTRLQWVSLSFTWTCEVSLGLIWYHLVSHGITWSHLAPHGLTWLHLVSPGLKGKGIRALGEKGKREKSGAGTRPSRRRRRRRRERLAASARFDARRRETYFKDVKLVRSRDDRREFGQPCITRPRLDRDVGQPRAWQAGFDPEKRSPVRVVPGKRVRRAVGARRERILRRGAADDVPRERGRAPVAVKKRYTRSFVCFRISCFLIRRATLTSV